VSVKIRSILLSAIILAAVLAPLLPPITTPVRAALTGTFYVYPEGNNTNATFTIYGWTKMVFNFTDVDIPAGANIYIWFSTNNQDTISPGDAWFIGPINQRYINSTANLLVPITISGTFMYSTWKQIEVTVGNNILTAIIPGYFIYNKTYYVKITDQPPSRRGSISSSDIIVSTNSFKVLPGTYCYNVMDNQYIYANSTIRVLTGALPTDKSFDILFTNTTETYNLSRAEPRTQIIYGGDYNPPWLWTGINTTLQAPDLGLYGVYTGTPYYVELNDTVTGTIYDKGHNDLVVIPRRVLNATTGYLYQNGTIIYNPSTRKTFYTGQRLEFVLFGWHIGSRLKITFLNTTGKKIKQLLDVPIGYAGLPLTSPQPGLFSFNIPLNLTYAGVYYLNISDGYIKIYLGLAINVTPCMNISATSGYVGDHINISLYHLENYTNYTFVVYYDDNGNNIPLSKFIVNSSTMNIPIIIPPSPSGKHRIWIGDQYGHQYPGIYPRSIYFDVKPSIQIIPPYITNTTRFITIICNGIPPGQNYRLMIDNKVILTNTTPTPDGIISATIPATGYYSGTHIVALYNLTSSGNTALYLSKIIGSNITLNIPSQTINLTNIVSLINNTLIEVKLLQQLVSALGNNITLSLQNINGSLADIILEGLAGTKNILLNITTKLEDLNATIISVKNDAVLINSTLGIIRAGLEEINSTGLKLVNLTITKAGDILAELNTTGGMIKAKLSAIEELINNSISVQGDLGKMLEKALQEINNTRLSIDELKNLVEQVGSNTTYMIKSLNNTLADLIVSFMVNDRKEHLEIEAKLDNINAGITDVKDNLVIINSSIGLMRIKIKNLLDSQAELKQLIITKSGEILGVINTKSMNITANLDDIKKLISKGLKIDVETISENLKKLILIVSNLNEKIVQGTTTTNNLTTKILSSIKLLNTTLSSMQTLILERIAKYNTNVLSEILSLNRTITNSMNKLQAKMMDLSNTQNKLSLKIDNTTSSLGQGLRSFINEKLGETGELNTGLYSRAVILQYVTIALVVIAIALSALATRRR